MLSPGRRGRASSRLRLRGRLGVVLDDPLAPRRRRRGGVQLQPGSSLPSCASRAVAEASGVLVRLVQLARKGCKRTPRGKRRASGEARTHIETHASTPSVRLVHAGPSPAELGCAEAVEHGGTGADRRPSKHRTKTTNLIRKPPPPRVPRRRRVRPVALLAAPTVLVPAADADRRPPRRRRLPPHR